MDGVTRRSSLDLRPGHVRRRHADDTIVNMHSALNSPNCTSMPGPAPVRNNFCRGVRSNQNVTPVNKPKTNAFGILPVPPGLIMYCKFGRRDNHGAICTL